MEGPAGRKRNYGWVVIGAFLGVDSMVHAIMFSLGVFLPPMSDELGMSLSQAGWLGSSNWMVPALLAIPFASLLARYRPKKLVALSTLVGVPLLFLQGWAPNYWVLLVARVAFLAITLARIPARPQLIRQWFPTNKITMVNTITNFRHGSSGGYGHIRYRRPHRGAQRMEERHFICLAPFRHLLSSAGWSWDARTRPPSQIRHLSPVSHLLLSLS